MELPEEVRLSVLSHFEVTILIEKKRVCRQWRAMCDAAIDREKTEESGLYFQSNEELKDAVIRYCGYLQHIGEDGESIVIWQTTSQSCGPDMAEEFAGMYGWPINRWNVSMVHDFSQIFFNCANFNEDISSWDVSNATTMAHMFFGARSFNCDISAWDVSNVGDMYSMFHGAASFSHDLSLWDTTQVVDMRNIFHTNHAYDIRVGTYTAENCML